MFLHEVFIWVWLCLNGIHAAGNIEKWEGGLTSAAHFRKWMNLSKPRCLVYQALFLLFAGGIIWRICSITQSFAFFIRSVHNDCFMRKWIDYMKFNSQRSSTYFIVNNFHLLFVCMCTKSGSVINIKLYIYISYL